MASGKGVLRPLLVGFLAVSLLRLGTACVYYETRDLSSKYGLPIDQRNLVIVHHGGTTFQIQDPDLVDGALSGYVVDSPRTSQSTRGQELHLYLSYSYPLEFRTDRTISIPIGAIARVEVYDIALKKTIVNTSILTSVITVLGVYVAMFYVALLTSCPYVHVQDGDGWRLAGEMYGGAIQPSLERDDYLPLPSVPGSGDELRVRLANELQETQYINHAELVVVDHPRQVAVLMDKSGRLVTLHDVRPPKSATDNYGQSLVEEIGACDERYVVPPVGAEHGSALQALYLTFDWPQGKRFAKLVVRGRNSLWLDVTLNYFIGMFGDAYPRWQALRASRSYDELTEWKRSQGIVLSVYLDRGGRWEFVGYFEEKGPIASRDDIMWMDLSGVQGDTVRLKLESGFLFWDLDFAGMDFTTEVPVLCQTVAPSRAVGGSGEDLLPALLADDSSYCHQTAVGDSAYLAFPLPAPQAGSARSLFLHSRGYYELNRLPQGNADIPALLAFRQPEAFAQLSQRLFASLRN